MSVEGSEEPATIGPFVVHRKLGEGAMGVVYAGYDVGLDRKVALKLVRRQLLNRPAVRDRMVREAKAMARLSSAHVVQVFQVGPHRDGIYVAMEYVEGVALGAWLKAAPRPWQAVLRTVCGAGRGLAAAHAAGLVHRDFKPDNVLVDANGHARVLDFGLVQSEHAPGAANGEAEELMQSTSGIEDTVHSAGAGAATGDAVERSNIHWSIRLTQIGRAVGTPAYMSPEQHFGEPVGPFSDQYSFAVTLYEALYGVRPFNADSWDSLKAQVRRGEVPPPPPDSRVPGWVHKILARGLAVEPDQRWPSVQAMVDALERDPRRTRMRALGLVGLVVTASAASYAAAASRAGVEEDRCGGGAQELAAVWDEARRQAVTRAFAGTRASFADDVLRRTLTRLDAYAGTWAAEHRAACEANVAGNQSDNLLDLRMACLGRRKMHVSALVDVLATADRSVVENAVQAVASLPSVRACADAEALLAVAPPADATTALRVDQLRRQLAQAEALEDTGRFEQGLVLASKARGEATPLGYAPLEAEAALGEGSLLMAVNRSAEADKALVHAIQLGIVHDLHAVAAEAATKRIYVLSQQMRYSAMSLATIPFAESLVQRAHVEGGLPALLQNNIGVAYAVSGDLRAGVVHFEKAIAQLERGAVVRDPLLAATYHNLGSMFVDLGQPEKARGSFIVARDLFLNVFGEHHPNVAFPLFGLGDVAMGQGMYGEAEINYRQAMVLMEAAFGREHSYLLQPLVGLGRVYARTGRVLEATSNFRRAVVLGESSEVKDVMFGDALEGLGEMEVLAGNNSDALRLFERAVEAYQATLGGDDGKLATAALHAGDMARKAGDTAKAIGWYERVLTIPSGTKAEERAAAALGLARELVQKPKATARVCDLLTEARLSLPAEGPLRAEAEALQASKCATSQR